MKILLLLLTMAISVNAHARGSVQNEDVKSQSDIQSSAGTITGNLTSGSACISSPSTTVGLAAGLFSYDSTTSTNISAGSTIAGLPGTCPAGQIQLSVNAAGSGTGDTITFGGQASQLINTSKIWDNINLQLLSSTISNFLPSMTGNAGKYLSTNGTVAAWSTVAGGSGAAVAVLTKTANYSLLTGDFSAGFAVMVEANCSSACTITLPAASNSGYQASVINIGSATATVATAGSDTFGSSADQTWTLIPGGSPQSSNKFISNGGSRWNGF